MFYWLILNVETEAKHFCGGVEEAFDVTKEKQSFRMRLIGHFVDIKKYLNVKMSD